MFQIQKHIKPKTLINRRMYKNTEIIRGRGSQKKSNVLVMAKSEITEPAKQGKKPRRVGA